MLGWGGDLIQLETLTKKSKFEYFGSIKTGTTIFYGNSNPPIRVSATQYNALITHFAGSTVKLGTSRDRQPQGSVGEWLIKNVTKKAIASYIGPILIEEGFAMKNQDPSMIEFK